LARLPALLAQERLQALAPAGLQVGVFQGGGLGGAVHATLCVLGTGSGSPVPPLASTILAIPLSMYANMAPCWLPPAPATSTSWPTRACRAGTRSATPTARPTAAPPSSPAPPCPRPSRSPSPAFSGTP